jgi:tetratricopeptide (TPR) repeat protein
MHAVRDWLARREAIKELAEVRRVERERDEMRFQMFLERIEAAMAADQHAVALRLWHEIREGFYLQATRSAKLFKILLDLREFDDAEKLISDGITRYPREQFYIVGRARVAEMRGDIETALERWRIVRQKFPYLALGYAQTAACLVKADRMDEADAMLAQGIKRSYNDVFCLMEHARIAEARGKFDQALDRWQHLRDVAPDENHPCYQNGTIGLAKCLRKFGRADDAEALLLPFVQQFGVEYAALIELAEIAADRGDAAEAIKRWQRIKNGFPLMNGGYLGQIGVLKKFGRTAEVEAVLFEAMDRMPGELWPAVDYANAAGEVGDHAESARRWSMVIERFPDCESAFRNRAHALAMLGRNDEADALKAEHATRFAE